jgi:hypothetical protein
MEALEEEESETEENTAEGTDNTEEVLEETNSEPVEEVTADEGNVSDETKVVTVPGNVNTENVNTVSKSIIPKNENIKSL